MLADPECPRAAAHHASLVAAFAARPVATWTLAAITAAVFVAGFVWHRGCDLTDPDGFSAFLLAGARIGPLVRAGEIWRLSSSMLLHASPVHLVFNLSALVLLGTIVERLYGSARFVALYVGAGLIANVALVNHTVPSVGASAAIAGLLGALVGFSLRWARELPRTMIRLVLGNVVLAIAAFWMVGRQSGNIDHAAHIAGASVGLLAGATLRPKALGRPATRADDGAAIIALVVLAIGIAGLGLAVTR